MPSEYNAEVFGGEMVRLASSAASKRANASAQIFLNLLLIPTQNQEIE